MNTTIKKKENYQGADENIVFVIILNSSLIFIDPYETNIIYPRLILLLYINICQIDFLSKTCFWRILRSKIVDIILLLFTSFFFIQNCSWISEMKIMVNINQCIFETTFLRRKASVILYFLMITENLFNFVGSN